jgi:hypothetical protein
MRADAREHVVSVVWDHVVRLFSDARMHHPASAKLEFDAQAHDSCRHFAACELDGSRVIVAPELADMPHATVLGILAHEAGHVEDLRSPGLWWFRNGLQRVEQFPSKGAKSLLRAWRDRSDDEVERVADALGELALGERIGYVGHAGCLVQRVGASRARPDGLK